MNEQNVTYFGDPRFLRSDARLQRPLNMLVLTSGRDVGVCDRNGRIVQTGHGRRYMEGSIERIVGETHEPGWRSPLGLTYAGRLAGLVKLVGVVTDDRQRDLEDKRYQSNYSFLPRSGRDWIHPHDLRTPDGRLVSDMTYNIRSAFRFLRSEKVEERRDRKVEFEDRIFQLMRELGADILLSDHYMAQLEHLYREPRLYGRIINIHPAVTVEGDIDCNRGPTPTANSLRKVRAGEYTEAGATLHFIGPIIDGGQPIACERGIPVYPTDRPQHLRYRNYTGAKLPLLVESLGYFAQHLFPNLDKFEVFEFNPKLSPLSAEQVQQIKEGLR